MPGDDYRRACLNENQVLDEASMNDQRTRSTCPTQMYRGFDRPLSVQR